MEGACLRSSIRSQRDVAAQFSGTAIKDRDEPADVDWP